MSIDFDHLVGDPIPGSTNAADVAAVVAQVAGMSDGVPVLLLPVRLETRFVQSERPSARAASAAGLATTVERAAQALAWIAAQDLATAPEGRGIAGRTTLRDLRRQKEQAQHAQVLASLGRARTAIAQGLLDARVALPAGTAEIARLRQAAAAMVAAVAPARASVGRIRSPFQKDESTRALAALEPDVQRLAETIEHRTIPAAATAGAVATELRDELWVRIFPDDIAVDTHEEALTESELASARTFWSETHAAGGDETLKRGAWRVLCQRHGVRRAAWIAQQTEALVPTAAAAVGAEAVGGVLRQLETLDRRLEEVAAASDRARIAAFERAVADLEAAAPASIEAADPPVLERAAPLLVTVRAKVAAMGPHVKHADVAVERQRRLKRRVLAVLRLIRRWQRGAQDLTRARLAPAADARPAGIAAGAGGRVARALETFAERLEDILHWDRRRADSWARDLQRALSAVTRALTADAGAPSPSVRERAERLLSTATAKLAWLSGEARRKRLPARGFREVRREAVHLRRAWEGWIGRPAAAPRPAAADRLATAATRPGAWTRAAASGVLPDRFVVVTVSDSRVSHVVAGAAVPPDLHLGLDPDPAGSGDETFELDAQGNLKIGKSIRWMVDFDEATARGMAVVLPITAEEARAGFDRVYVLGLCGGTAEQGRDRVAALLDNHHYGHTGLGLLPIGTPTNNSERGAAGYSSEPDVDTAYLLERGPPLFDAAASDDEARDGLRLARALGVAPQTLAHVAHADGRDVADARLVNAALWPATIGHYLEEFFGSLFPVSVLDQIKAIGLGHVAARGLVPGLRVGAQPYGVLPTTVFSRLGSDAAAGSFAGLLPRVLNRMNADWTRIRDEKVQHVHRAGVTDRQQQFLDMLGLEGTSVSAEYRYALNCARHQPKATGAAGQLDFGVPGDAGSGLYGPVALLDRFSEEFRAGRRLGPGPVLSGGQVSSTFKDPYLRLTKARAYEVRYLLQPRPLTGTVVGDHATYIGQLLSRSARQLAEQTRSGDADARPLLYLLLRQALLLETREAALRILAAERMLTDEARRRSGESDVFQVHTLAADWSVTRWSYLFAPLSQLDGRFAVSFPTGGTSFYDYMRTGGDRSMDAYVSPRTGNRVFDDFARHGAHRAQMAALTAHASAVARLADLSAERLEPLVLEHVDTCSHRLDAWLTGLAHGRLAAMRAAAPEGAFVGMFGWLDDLRPAPAKALATGVSTLLAEGGSAPIHADPSGEGFIHAPSLAHAVTASILRSGYLSETEQPDVENKMAVNLSSRRVRLAEELIEGVRRGNDLGSLLGYRFERSLHDAFATAGVTLDALIEPLRRAYPSVLAVDPSLSSDATTARRVVDGLAIVQTVLEWVRLHPQPRYRNRTLFEVLRDNGAYTGWPFGIGGAAGAAVLPDTQPANQVRLDAVLRALDGLADALDAVADLVVGESVFQIVQGNHARAAAVVGALARGKAPPRPEIIDTPRSGLPITHRVLLAMPPIDARTFSSRFVADAARRAAQTRAALAPGWSDLPMTARAAAEPSLNAWLGALLGVPTRIAARVRDVASGSLVPVTAADLALQPIDLLALLGPDFDAGLSELTQRVLAVADPADWSDTHPPAPTVVVWDRAPGAASGTLTFEDAGALFEAVHDLLGHARLATSHEFTLAEAAGTAAAVDVAELRCRAEDAIDRLEAAGLELAGLLSEGTQCNRAALADPVRFVAAHEGRFLTPLDARGQRRLVDLAGFWADRQSMRSALLHAAESGTANALPPRAASTAPTREETCRQMLERLQAAFIQVAMRWQAASEAAATAGAVPGDASAWMKVLTAIYGDSFRAMPHFTLDRAAPVLASMKAMKAPRADPTLSGWLHAAAMVRSQVQALARVVGLSEAFGGPAPSMWPAQLPATEGEPWLGDEWPAGFVPEGGRLAIVIVGASALATDGTSSCGWLLDQWEEAVPSREETTGVAFHHDSPDAMPPQSLLLVVPPVARGAWRWSELLQSLHETFELARNRAVELEHLQGDLYGQILPAVVGELVPESVTTTVTEIAGSRVILDFGRNNPLPAPPG